jgi:hypothetical protein
MVLYTDEDKGVNFLGVDSLRFKALGNGLMRVVFITELPAAKNVVRFTKFITLSQSVGDVSIALKSNNWDVTPDDSLGIGWAGVCQKVKMIEFGFYGSENSNSDIHLVIDNVVFVGDGVLKSITGISGR